MKEKKDNLLEKALKTVAKTTSQSASWFFYEPEVPKKLLNKRTTQKD